MNIWVTWKERASQIGLRSSFTENPADYPPLSRLILHIWPGTSSRFDIKLLILVFFLLTAGALQVALKNRLDVILSMALLSINSLALGYLDILWAPFLVAAVWSLRRGHLVRFSVYIAISSQIKWQPLIILPVFLAYLYFTDDDALIKQSRTERVLRGMLPFAALWILTGLFFGFNSLEVSRRNAFNNQYLSGNALNLPWMVGGIKQGLKVVVATPLDEVPSWFVTFTNGLARILALVILLSFIRGRRTLESAILASICIGTLYFVLSTGVHENHLFLAAILSLMGYSWYPKYREVFLAISVLSVVNLVVFYGLTGTGLGGSRNFLSIDLTMPIALVNTVGLLFAIVFLTKSMQIEKVHRDEVLNPAK